MVCGAVQWNCYPAVLKGS